MRMNAKRIFFGLGMFALFVGLSSPAFAQRFEVHPYAGGFIPGDWKNEYELKNEGVYGVKAGVFATDRLLLEGHWGWMPHMEFKGTDPGARGMIWEFAPSINFFDARFSKALPYITVGFGGVTGYIRDIPTNEDRDAEISGVSVAFRGENDNEVKAADILLNARPKNVDTPVRSLILEDGDTFLTVSYGGGVKALNLLGPMGVRADFRGRSMPNFFGNSVSWLEMSGGLTFTWGER
jgi:hypothetical protein